MTAASILSNLKLYQKLLYEIRQYALSKTSNREELIKLTSKIKIEYDFITLDLLKEDLGSTKSSLYCRVVFEIQNSAAILDEVFAENKSDIPGVEKLIRNHQSTHNYTWLKNPSDSKLYNEEILRYLAIADSIAKQTLNCAHGDDYRP
ncbi:MAG TPA: hypothetical protein VIT44_02730, partial [Cyclobacteriaceae bacterium]